MGASRKYWIEKLQVIYDKYKFECWSWKDANELGVTNSDLRRLNYSDWFIKIKGDKYAPTRHWKLTSDVIDLMV